MRSPHSIPRLRQIASDSRKRADQMIKDAGDLRKQADDYDDIADEKERAEAGNTANALAGKNPLPIEKEAAAGAAANGTATAGTKMPAPPQGPGPWEQS